MIAHRPYGEQLLRPLRLSDRERDDLILESLTDPGATVVPPPPTALAGCRP